MKNIEFYKGQLSVHSYDKAWLFAKDHGMSSNKTYSLEELEI